MKINKSRLKEQWVKIDEDVEVLLQPFPASRNIFQSVENRELDKIYWKMFNYSVLDWKGLVDENDKPLECNEENKQVVFDFAQEVMMEITSKITEISNIVDIEEEKKT